MTWILHQTYKRKMSAKKNAKLIIDVGLAKGIKIVPKGKSYLLYILPLNERKG